MEVPFWHPNLNDIATDILILKISFFHSSKLYNVITSLRQ